MKARVATARVMLEWVWEMLNSGTEYRGINRDLVKRKMQKTRRIAESPGVTPGTSVRGVSPPLHRRGAAQRPLPFPPAAKNSVGSSRPARAARRGSRRHTGTSRVFNRLPPRPGGGNCGSCVGGSQRGLRAIRRSRPGQTGSAPRRARIFKKPAG